MLDRHQQVARVWDWLPAFRAAAEYESLQRAGLALSLSPSALSRSIKLLEDTLGLTLFTRSPSGLTLTEHGHRLLTATREAMRRVHEGLAVDVALRLRAGAVGPVLPRVLCEAAIDALPNWSLHFSVLQVGHAAEQLRCGELDVALSHEPLNASDLTCAPLPGLEFALVVPPQGNRERLVCLEQTALSLPGANVTAADVDQLLRLAERLGASACVPLMAIPEGWVVEGAGPSAPVFAVTRAYTEAPAFIGPLCAALTARLSMRTARVT